MSSPVDVSLSSFSDVDAIDNREIEGPDEEPVLMTLCDRFKC